MHFWRLMLLSLEDRMGNRRYWLNSLAGPSITDEGPVDLALHDTSTNDFRGSLHPSPMKFSVILPRESSFEAPTIRLCHGNKSRKCRPRSFISWTHAEAPST